MMSIPRFGSVIYAKEFRTLADFYRKVAGLHVGESTREYVLLTTTDCFLVVLQMPSRIAETITIETPPRRRQQTPVKLIFAVESLQTARKVAAANGGELHPASREWSFHGLRRCDGVDPEGNVFQLQEA